MEMKTIRELEPTYRPRAFAEAVDLSLGTIYRKIANGEIKVMRLGTRTLRIPLSEVRRLRGEPIS
jgi:excisionase family DNA binding protein